MDPISTPLATSLARLNILTSQITRTTSDILSGVVFAPSFARVLHDDVDETHAMVVQLQDFIDSRRNPEHCGFFEITLSGFTATFAACALHLYRLRRQLKLLQRSSRKYKLGLIDCAKWMLKERAMRKTLEDLQTWKSMLALLLSICNDRIREILPVVRRKREERRWMGRRGKGSGRTRRDIWLRASSQPG